MKNNLTEYREKLHLTQKDVATAVNLLPQAYQRYEYGTRIPSVEIAIKIARALNTTVEELFVLEDGD